MGILAMNVDDFTFCGYPLRLRLTHHLMSIAILKKSRDLSKQNIGLPYPKTYMLPLYAQ